MFLLVLCTLAVGAAVSADVTTQRVVDIREWSAVPMKTKHFNIPSGQCSAYIIYRQYQCIHITSQIPTKLDVKVEDETFLESIDLGDMSDVKIRRKPPCNGAARVTLEYMCQDRPEERQKKEVAGVKILSSGDGELPPISE